MSFEPPADGSGYLILLVPEPCPACGDQGSFIPPEMIVHHLEHEGLSLVQGWTKGFLCSNPSCDILYYSLWKTVPIRYCNKTLGFKKNSPPPHLLCHCLGFTVEEILRDGSAKGPGSCVEMIKRHIEQGFQLCSIKNPTGRCCWDQVQKILEKGI